MEFIVTITELLNATFIVETLRITGFSDFVHRPVF
jgi:hypothetical protein